MDAEHAASLRRRYLIQFEEDTLRPQPLWIRLIIEFVGTATGHRSVGHNAAIAVGSTVALLGLFASSISGASMNPARTLAPDIVGHDYTGWWVYVAGPVIGAAIAVAIIAAVRGLPDKREAAPGGALPIRGAPRDGHPEGRQAPAG
jgi:aquaporin Z